MPTLRVNGASRTYDAAPDATLLDVLRGVLGLTGTKEACGRGECGACTVLVDGKPTLSCLTIAALVQEEVSTVEGLADEALDLREAFAVLGGFQCGYCTPGQIVHGIAILRDLAARPVADPEAEIRHRLSGNICRCTGYSGIVKAVLQTLARRRSAA